MEVGRAGSGKAPLKAEDGEDAEHGVSSPGGRSSQVSGRALGKAWLDVKSSLGKQAPSSPVLPALTPSFTRKTRPPSRGTSHCRHGCGLLEDSSHILVPWCLLAQDPR